MSKLCWSQDNNSAQIQTNVITTLTIDEKNPLTFGKFSTKNGGKLILSFNGVITSLGSVTVVGDYSKYGVFFITGCPESTYSIILPTTVVLKHQILNIFMVVDNWNSNTIGILKNGEDFIYVGATLNINKIEDNPIGLYSGTYNLVITYN